MQPGTPGDVPASSGDATSPAAATAAADQVVIAGRYQLLTRFGDDADTGTGRLSTWRARDNLLRRDVLLRIHSPGGTAARGLLDRSLAAGVLSHPALAMVYDAVDEGRRSYVVSEWVEGQSLSRALTGGPLPEAYARETIRRVAEGVAQSHQIGLPVGGLVPDRIILTATGAVAVAGIPAPTADVDDDVRALGQLLFATMAGFLPNTDDISELDRQLTNASAPDLADTALAVLDGRIHSAAELVAELVAHRRPGSPAEPGGLALITDSYEYDGPSTDEWPTISGPRAAGASPDRGTSPGGDPPDDEESTGRHTAPPGAPSRFWSAARSAGRRARRRAAETEPPEAAVGGSTAIPPTDPTAVVPPVHPIGAADPPAPPPGSAAPPAPPATAADLPTAADPPSDPAMYQAAAAGPDSPGSVPSADRASDTTRRTPAGYPAGAGMQAAVDPTDTPPPATVGDAVPPAVAVAGAAAAGPTSAPHLGVGPALGPAATLGSDTASGIDSALGSDTSSGAEPDPVVPEPADTGTWTADWIDDDDDDHRPSESGDYDYNDDDESGARRRTWLVLAFPVAALLAVALIGWVVGSSFLGAVEDPAPQTSAQSSAVTTTAVTTTTTPPPEPAPVPVLTATVFDPFGDGEPENNGDSPQSFDGDPATSWPTLTYRGSANLGNLKPGVGLVFDLGAPAVLSEVRIITEQPGATVEIRGGTVPTAADLEPFPVRGRGVLQPETTIALDGAEPAQYWIVWITELVPDGGSFSASLAEVSFVGVPTT